MSEKLVEFTIKEAEEFYQQEFYQQELQKT